jgi:hypothetical protein
VIGTGGLQFGWNDDILYSIFMASGAFMRNVNWLVQKIFYLHKSVPLYKLAVTPEQSKIYDVSYMKQQHANMCLDASENMINFFFKKPLQQLKDNPRGVFDAKEQLDNNFNEEMLDISTLKAKIDTKGPLILSIPLRYGFEHAITCIGYSKNHIIYHDPLTNGNRCISLKELKRITVEYSTSDSPLTISYYRHAAEIDLAKLQRPVNSNETIKTSNTNKSSFLFSKSESMSDKNSVIDFLNDYLKGNKFFKLLNNQIDKVKNCITRLKKESGSKPEMIMQIVQNDLSKLLKSNALKRNKP